jgi:hypothetical protein
MDLHLANNGGLRVSFSSSLGPSRSFEQRECSLVFWFLFFPEKFLTKSKFSRCIDVGALYFVIRNKKYDLMDREYHLSTVNLIE